MSDAARPSVLYVVPGHDFLPTAGPTRNVLNQARAIAAWADVTLAFRRIIGPATPGDPAVLEIDPSGSPAGPSVDDAATRGMSYGAFLRYLRRLRRFLAERLPSTDLVLEKDWMLTGWVARESRRLGVPCIPVKNWVALPARSGGLPRAVRHAAAAATEGWLLRRTGVVVVETDILEESLVRRMRLDPKRIEVIGLGVDRERFRPSDAAAARERLGIPPEGTVLFYAGILDRTHDLEPLLRALVRLRDPRVRLEIVGDGPFRDRYERWAREAASPVVFRGRVPHAEVPIHIAAADLCVAPYEPAAFPRGEVAYSTLKVREYLSAGRAVATMGSGSLRRLVRDGESGFLLENDEGAWLRLLRRLPARDRLAEMGEAAARTQLETWGDVARSFERLGRRLIAEAPARRAAGAVRSFAARGV